MVKDTNMQSGDISSGRETGQGRNKTVYKQYEPQFWSYTSRCASYYKDWTNMWQPNKKKFL
jgi:hypothetical protein